MPEPFTVLVAEDDSNDALLLKLALAKAGVNAPMHFVRDGIEAMDYLRGVPPFDNRDKHPLPNLLVLDLKMPQVGGLEVLAWLRKQPASDEVTVVVLSGSCWQADIDRAYALGAKFCVKKSFDFRQVGDVVNRMEKQWSIPLIPVRCFQSGGVCLERVPDDFAAAHAAGKERKSNVEEAG